ncbi:zinc finger, CCHC-type containing protein [Tanacetum coccineum]
MVAAMKHMASNFSKLEKFKGVNFKIWQKKIYFLLSSISMVYVLTTPMLEDGGDNPTMEQVRNRSKWDNDDYVCRGLILIGMSDSLFTRMLKVLKNYRIPWKPNIWLRMPQDNDKPKGNNVFGPLVVNMVEHNNSSRYNDNKGKRKHHDTRVDPNKKPKVICWKCGKPRDLKRDYKAGNDGNKSNRSAFMSTSELNNSILWHARLGHVHFKRMQDMSKDGLILAFDMDTKKAVVRLPYPKLKTLGERGIECIFVGYAEHSKAFRFFVIEPNNSVAINSIIESRDAIFDEHRFSLVPRPSQRSLVRGNDDFGGSVVPEKVTNEIVPQSEPELRKSKRHRTPKDFGPEFQLYLIKGTWDEVSDQHSYCFNVENDPKSFYEAMKSQDVAF